MNWAAIISFLHPMLSVIVACGYVLYILKKDYAFYVVNQNRLYQNLEANDEERIMK
ncbi:hypothetical protein GLW07_12485 [Bacillus hwajinpoensis]|jgi:hypothetical protein|uniref:Uncharacterized protein n=1 Tax=Guptibacillus hwajinpoensis TaxID=208199 RepID=A0A845F037_9BACL|nr:hypothetical protein [Pseudalkalibacillus hwajinpoensis]MYL64170.1 hypothetical protein [Pseudalkalibacillus hwajinpoensis]